MLRLTLYENMFNYNWNEMLSACQIKKKLQKLSFKFKKKSIRSHETRPFHSISNLQHQACVPKKISILSSVILLLPFEQLIIFTVFC